MSFKRAYWLSIVIIVAAFTLGASTVSQSDPLEHIRVFTRAIEFDYASWTLHAITIKLSELALGTNRYLNSDDGSKVVLEALDLVRQINEMDARLTDIYSDPNIKDPQSASAELLVELNGLQAKRTQLEPLAEAVMQEQVNEIAAEAGLTLGGQAFPPVLFHTTPPPDALIISPRNVIRLDYDISISPDLRVDQIENLESQVDKSLNVSSLVEKIGGVGLYPDMVMETSDINWLADVVTHEWIHNYLTVHPLGISYMNSPELRTMNELAAGIAGKELGKALVKRYYPEYLPPEPIQEAAPAEPDSKPPSPPVFNFVAEMHETRVETDRLLAEGKIEQAEAYMEQRRQFLWEHGYHIRKLNQAYFAFWGAYVESPGGEAGEDPVVTAVYLLREKSSSLADFINRMAWMWNFDQLKKAVGSR